MHWYQMRNSDWVDTSRLSNSHQSIFMYTYIHKFYMDHITYHPNWANFVRSRKQEQTMILWANRGIAIQHVWLRRLKYIGKCNSLLSTITANRSGNSTMFACSAMTSLAHSPGFFYPSWETTDTGDSWISFAVVEGNCLKKERAFKHLFKQMSGNILL